MIPSFDSGRWAGAVVAALAAAAAIGPASAEERQIVYYSVWGDCIGDPRTPLCALDTLFSCMVRNDQGMCADVGAAGEMGCRITGVRYVVDGVTETENAARLAFRAQVCRDDAPCRTPSREQTEDLERIADRWRFRAIPKVHAQMCGR